MKALFLILLTFFSIVSNGQQKKETKSDSIALVSRSFGDKVLAKFDTVKTSKILYSLDNQYFYVIINNNPYKEFFIRINKKGQIDKIEKIKPELKTRKQRKENKQYCKLLSKAEPLFDINKYRNDFLTKMPEATYINGRSSYFVLKDENGKRYGEYSLSTVTIPLPISTNLWIYLNKRLSDKLPQNQ